MILGILCGMTLNITYGPINIAEIIFIIYGILYMLRTKKVKIDKNFKAYFFMMVFFILYTLFYYKIEIVNRQNILKNVFKYSEMLVVTFLAYQLCIYDINKFLRFCASFLVSEFLMSFVIHNYSSLSYFLHYSLFLLPIYIIMIWKCDNKKSKMVMYAIALILSIIGRSRSSLIILLITILYYMYQYILGNNKGKKDVLKKLLVLFILLIVSIIGIDYFTNNLSIKSKSNMERTLLIDTTLQEIKDNILVGVGPGNFNYYAQNILGVKLASNDLTAHNHFLEVFSEWGLIGFALYMSPLMIFFVQLIRKDDSNLKMKRIYIFYFVFLFFNVLAGDARLKFAIILAIMFYDLYISEKENINEKRNSDIEF